MDIFERASRKKLRFHTNMGTLLTEDLWDMDLTQLDELAQQLNREVEATQQLSFIAEKKVANPDHKLRFDLALHVINAKLATAKSRERAAEKKALREQLLATLQKRQDEGREALTEAEILAQLEELDKE